MIVRVLRTRVRRERASEFQDRAMAKLAAVRRVDGLIDAQLVTQAGPLHHEFLFITRWPTMTPLYEWAGGLDLLAQPLYFSGLEEFLDDFNIQHYVDLEGE